jgi:hypothetical protein
VSRESFQISDDGDVAVVMMRHTSQLYSEADRLIELDHWQSRAASGSLNSRAFVLTGFGSTATEEESAASLDHYLSPSAIDPRVSVLAWPIDRLPGPLVSAVDGLATGYARLTALMSDATIASNNAAFLHPYRSTGAVAGLGLTNSLASRLGRLRTVEFVALGKPLPAEQAADGGSWRRRCPQSNFSLGQLGAQQHSPNGLPI